MGSKQIWILGSRDLPIVLALLCVDKKKISIFFGDQGGAHPFLGTFTTLLATGKVSL